MEVGMARYRINVTEKNYGSVTVEADSPDKAFELAEKAYVNGDVSWCKTDFQTGGYEEV